MNARCPTVALSVCLALLAGVVPAHADDAPDRPTAPSAVQATGAAEVRTGVEALAGRWIVDLRAAPDEPEYEKPMVLEIAADRSVQGSFYDSTIDAGRASDSNGRTCFAFRTTDGAGPYHTSGCLVDDRILGQTWAEHRRFVLNWTAARH